MQKSEKTLALNFMKLERPHFGTSFGNFWPKKLRVRFSSENPAL